MGDVVGSWSRARFLMLRLGLPPLLVAGMLTAAAGSADAQGTGQPPILQAAQSAILRLSHQPFAVAFTPDGHYAYVANGDADSGLATVFDATPFPPQMVANVAVGNQPTAVAVTPDGRYAYVASDVLNTVSVIDTTASPPHVVATVAVSGNPVAVAMAPAGHYAYVASATSSIISVIDTTAAPPQVVATVSVHEAPDSVAFTPDGRYAYVVNGASSTVSVISAAIFPPAVVATVAIPASPDAGPYALAITPDGHYAYVGSVNADTVSVIDTTASPPHVTATVAVPGSPGGGPDGIAFTPDGRLAYVTNFAGGPAVNVIDTTATPPRVAYTIELPTAAPVFGVAISPDGRFAYLAGGRPYSVSVVPVRPAAASASVLSADSVLTPLRVATTSLPQATAGAAYRATLAASGGLPRYRWSITSGSLPTGLRLHRATGTISGVPTQPGQAVFTVQATDSGNPPRSAAETLSVIVEGAPPPAATSQSLVIQLPAGTTVRLGTAPLGPLGTAAVSTDGAAANNGTTSPAVNAGGAVGKIEGDAPVNVVPTLPPIPVGPTPKPRPAAAQGTSGGIAALPAVAGLAFGLTIGLGAALIALLRPTWFPARLSRRFDGMGRD